MSSPLLIAGRRARLLIDARPVRPSAVTSRCRPARTGELPDGVGRGRRDNCRHVVVVVQPLTRLQNGPSIGIGFASVNLLAEIRYARGLETRARHAGAMPPSSSRFLYPPRDVLTRRVEAGSPSGRRPRKGCTLNPAFDRSHRPTESTIAGGIERGEGECRSTGSTGKDERLRTWMRGARTAGSESVGAMVFWRRCRSPVLRRPRCDRSRGASSFRRPPGEATITSRAPCQKLCATRGAPPQGTRSVQPFLVLSWLDSLLPDG